MVNVQDTAPSRKRRRHRNGRSRLASVERMNARYLLVPQSPCSKYTCESGLCAITRMWCLKTWFGSGRVLPLRCCFRRSLILRFPGFVPAFSRYIGYIIIPLRGTRICQDRSCRITGYRGNLTGLGHIDKLLDIDCTLLDSESPWWSVVLCSICMAWVFIGYITIFLLMFFLAFSIPIALNSPKEQFTSIIRVWILPCLA